jgi:uncharacterized protein YmfQ (DUF2313 family)
VNAIVALTPKTPEDFLWQFQRLLPRGRIWHRGWGTAEAEQLLTLMPTWVRLDTRAANLIIDAFPCSTTELLPEWEATLGLPDPCTGPLATLQQRTAAVCGKFAARGGQSREYFIRLAASLGYQIEIETFKPFYASQGYAGYPCYDESWAFAIRIVVEGDDTVVWFRASASAAQEPLADYLSTLVQCVIERMKPANCTIIWAYRIDAAIWDAGASIWDVGDSIWDQGAVSNDVAN